MMNWGEHVGVVLSISEFISVLQKEQKFMGIGGVNCQHVKILINSDNIDVDPVLEIDQLGKTKIDQFFNHPLNLQVRIVRDGSNNACNREKGIENYIEEFPYKIFIGIIVDVDYAYYSEDYEFCNQYIPINKLLDVDVKMNTSTFEEPCEWDDFEDHVDHHPFIFRDLKMKVIRN
jgi:hypothetical protein